MKPCQTRLVKDYKGRQCHLNNLFNLSQLIQQHGYVSDFEDFVEREGYLRLFGSAFKVSPATVRGLEK